jgi:hypothetical protein
MRHMLILLFSLFAAFGAAPFQTAGWKGFRTITVAETAGLAREKEPVDAAFTIPAADTSPAGYRVVADSSKQWIEIPSQVYQLRKTGKSVSGRIAFFCAVPAGKKRIYRLYYGNPGAAMPQYPTGLSVKPADKGPIEGPMHWMIENNFYRIETFPKNAQVWHIWDKKGRNIRWWFKEWTPYDSGGNPVNWSPNTWIAYPDRARAGVGKEDDVIDWHYVVGWDNPEHEIISGPIFHEIRRKGPVWPHPDRVDTAYARDRKIRTRAEIVYRFYDGLPWFYQWSHFSTHEDFYNYFIRNCQWVFNDSIFSSMAIVPQTKALEKGDEEEMCLMPLMSHFDRKPFHEQHSLSNVVPSKIRFYTYFNPATRDAFADIQLLEHNWREPPGEPAYTNHAMIFTELHGWAVYFARAFDYTNKRFCPENTAFLPKGHHFEEENAIVVYGYDSPEKLDWLKRLDRELNAQLQVKVGP